MGIFNKIGKKQWVLILSLTAVLLVAAGSVFGYIMAQTPEVKNTFDPVVVTCAVEEQFDGVVKQDVCIRNTGDVDAYIRAMVLINWADPDGKVLAADPVEGIDYVVQWGDARWVKGNDGFWYYTEKVVSQEATADLIETLTVNESVEGYQLMVQILATAIQAEPITVVENTWGVTVDQNSITIS